MSSQPDRGDLSAIDGAVEVIFFDFDGTLTESPCHGFENFERLAPGQIAKFFAGGDVWRKRPGTCHAIYFFGREHA